MKGLILAIRAWFTNMFASKTDIGLAGQQVIRDTKKAIKDVQDSIINQRATGLGYENDIIKLDDEIKKSKESYQYHTKLGNVDMASKAKRVYEASYKQRIDKQKLLDEVLDTIADLEDQLNELSNDTDSAKNKFESNATRQKAARAAMKVEDAHDNLKDGNIGLAIEQADRMSNVASARRTARQNSNNRDIYAYANELAIPDINDGMELNTPTNESNKSSNVGLSSNQDVSGYTDSSSTISHSRSSGSHSSDSDSSSFSSSGSSSSSSCD